MFKASSLHAKLSTTTSTVALKSLPSIEVDGEVKQFAFDNSIIIGHKLLAYFEVLDSEGWSRAVALETEDWKFVYSREEVLDGGNNPYGGCGWVTTEKVVVGKGTEWTIVEVFGVSNALGEQVVLDEWLDEITERCVNEDSV